MYDILPVESKSKCLLWFAVRYHYIHKFMLFYCVLIMSTLRPHERVDRLVMICTVGNTIQKACRKQEIPPTTTTTPPPKAIRALEKPIFSL